MASPVERLRRTGHDEVRFRRARVRELLGSGYTNMQIMERVNDALEAEGLHPVSWETLVRDRILIRKDFQEAVSEDTHLRAQEHAARLMHLEQRMNDDYERAREKGKNPALLADNLRKVIMDRAKLDGSLVEKHQHDGTMTVEHHLREILSIKPETLEVLDLLPDEEYSIAPRKKLAADG